jgi:ribosomal protein S1
MGTRYPAPSDQPDHGAHTLKVWKGSVVGVYGDDVFVELGARMQGVISRREFETPPAIGDEFEFTLRGREDGLWALARREHKSLATWEDMERGSLVHARVIRAQRDGLELKIGPLHAFMPKSHTGLARDEQPSVLVGRTLVCEVIEVDSERQRVLLSHKLVLQRERVSERQRVVDTLAPGQVVQGRVTRIEPYGAFVTLANGVEGLVHVSNIAYERVEHPGAVLRLGQTVSAKVLAIREGGKRVALGLKQLRQSPWAEVELEPGRVVSGTVKRVLAFGAFIAVLPGVEGLLHNSQVDLRGQRDLRAMLQPGEQVSVRVLELDGERERLSLSLRHEDGRPIERDEAESVQHFEQLSSAPPPRGSRLELRRLLDQALRASDDPQTRAG